MTNQRPPLPASGWKDLSVLKEGNREAQDANELEQLRQNGLVCGCGRMVEGEGVELIGVWKGLAPTPIGPQDAAALIRGSYCSKTCSHITRIIAEGEMKAMLQGPMGEPFEIIAKPRAIRHLPVVEWLPAVQVIES